MDTEEPGDSDSGQGVSAGFALKTNLWVGRDRLKVYFLNPEVLKSWMCGKEPLNVRNILDWAGTWKVDKGDSVPDFQRTDRQEGADIRVKFQGMLQNTITLCWHSLQISRW